MTAKTAAKKVATKPAAPSYEDRIADLNASTAKMDEAQAASNLPLAAAHADAHVKTHVVLIPSEFTSNKTVRFQNGPLFQEVLVGVETEVGAEIMSAIEGSDVPHESRAL